MYSRQCLSFLVMLLGALVPLGAFNILAAAHGEGTLTVSEAHRGAAPAQPRSMMGRGELPLETNGSVITDSLLIADQRTYTEGLTVPHGLTVSGDLTVTHGLTVGMGLSVTGNLIVTGGLSVSVSAETPVATGKTIAGGFVVTDVQTLTGPHTIAGSLTVEGDGELTVSGGLVVTGDVTVTGKLSVVPFQLFMPAVANYVVVQTDNGRFEDGPESWHQFSTNGLGLILPASDVGVPAHSGDWIASLGRADDEISMISQGVSIAKDTSCLVYWQWTLSNDVCNADYGGVGINGIWVNVHSLCAGTSTARWVRQQISMTQYSVEMTTTATVLNFAVVNDYSVPSTMHVDDIAFFPTELCDPNANPVPAADRSKETRTAGLIGKPITSQPRHSSK